MATSTGPLGAAAMSTIATTDLEARDQARPSNDTAGSPIDAEPLYPGGIPEPRGIQVGTVQDPNQAEGVESSAGTGVEGEVVVWEAGYSTRNFIGRFVVRILLTVAWLGLAIHTWGMGNQHHATLTWIAGAIVGAFWLQFGVRVIQARYSHFYRLTNRRLFVTTGLWNRRVDMMELLSVKDVFIRQQNIIEHWLCLGTVVVEPSEKDIPTFYMPGVEDPKEVMDLIWHQARTERDMRTLKVDSV